MKRPNNICLILLAATISLCVCYQPGARYASAVEIKVENDGGIVIGFGRTSVTTQPYDPYFIHVNDAPHIQISVAKATGGAK
jgi:hypothetical protein